MVKVLKVYIFNYDVKMNAYLSFSFTLWGDFIMIILKGQTRIYPDSYRYELCCSFYQLRIRVIRNNSCNNKPGTKNYLSINSRRRAIAVEREDVSNLR